MTIEQASVFFVASILTCLGFIVLTIGVVVINNIFAKYWKQTKLFKFIEYPPVYNDEVKDGTSKTRSSGQKQV